MSAWRVIRSGLESWVGELPREASDGEALHLILDGPSPVNALSSAVLRELAEITPALAKEEGVRALLLWSAKEAHFVAGADIEEIAAIDDPESARRLAAEGQKVLDGLARLPYPTFAVIGGTCLGGGLELALACDYRVAVNASSTKIGLPEVQLGIIPGFGGTWRLPRLIGIRSALGLIVAGSRLPAKAAFKKGIVDALVPPEGHREAAMLAARQILKDGGSAV
ncbi:MAG: enoyl-CoA hydratase-related protein, partial [Planctomycetota bacterium]